MICPIYKHAVMTNLKLFKVPDEGELKKTMEVNSQCDREKCEWWTEMPTNSVCAIFHLIHTGECNE